MSRAELYIDGRWRNGAGAEFTALDPATGAVVWRGPAASVADVAAAAQAARNAFPAWSQTSLERRREIVRAFGREVEAAKEELARLITSEMGKPLWEARTEAQAVIAKIEISITAQDERAGARAQTAAFGAMRLDHRAHGVFAVLGPFNFPAHLPNGHIVPALLAGDTLVFKPSEQCPGVGAFLAAAWERAGLPSGVLNLVQGGGDVGAALVAQAIEGVLFTGSYDVGRRIHAAFAGRPEAILALEMGGNNPLIVWPPVDPSAAANLIAHSAFATTGQRCSCARRLILPDGAQGDDILDALAAQASRIVAGPGLSDPPPFMGPLANLRSAERAEAAVRGLQAMGAQEITPWSRSDAFVAPCVLTIDGVDAPDHEIFAPVLLVSRAASFDDALRLANATRYGLAGGLVSDDPALWAQTRAHLRAGVLNWNRPTTGASSAMPFGGPGLSGSGRPSAFYAADYCAYPVAIQEAERAAAMPAPGLS